MGGSTWYAALALCGRTEDHGGCLSLEGVLLEGARRLKERKRLVRSWSDQGGHMQTTGRTLSAPPYSRRICIARRNHVHKGRKRRRAKTLPKFHHESKARCLLVPFPNCFLEPLLVTMSVKPRYTETSLSDAPVSS